jgi:hypothetical protein
VVEKHGKSFPWQKSIDASLYGKSFISLAIRRNPLIICGSRFCSLLEISSIEAFIPLMSTSTSWLEITSIESFKHFSSLLKSWVGDGDVMLGLLVAREDFLEFPAYLIDINNYEEFFYLLEIMKLDLVIVFYEVRKIFFMDFGKFFYRFGNFFYEVGKKYHR